MFRLLEHSRLAWAFIDIKPKKALKSGSQQNFGTIRGTLNKQTNSLRLFCHQRAVSHPSTAYNQEERQYRPFSPQGFRLNWDKTLARIWRHKLKHELKRLDGRNIEIVIAVSVEPISLAKTNIRPNQSNSARQRDLQELKARAYLVQQDRDRAVEPNRLSADGRSLWRREQRKLTRPVGWVHITINLVGATWGTTDVNTCLDSSGADAIPI